MTLKKRIGLLNEWQARCSVSGRENGLTRYIASSTNLPWETDDAGNLFARRKGRGKDKMTILVEAHLDEIGLVISDITPDGFLAVQTIGGIDKSILQGTFFEIFGKEKVPALACALPPHLTRDGKDGKELPFYLDAVYDARLSAEKAVNIGDPVHFYGPAVEMENGRILSRGLDNKGGVLAALEAFEKTKDPYHDVILLLSAGEETGGRGALAFTQREKIDLAFVVDAGFARAEGVDSTRCLVMGEGPSVSLTDTLCTPLSRWVIQVAKKNSIPCQIICEPGGTGTDATLIQNRRGGIPSAVISFPLLNMHTPSEIVSNKDLNDTVLLLQAILNEKNVPLKGGVEVE